MRLLMVRHAETTWNREGRYQGRRESELSTRGVGQAQALAQRLATENATSIISSPLLRTRLTSQLCAERLGVGVYLDERITEISHGLWEGKLRGEVEARWPELWHKWCEAPQTVRFPGGESLADVQRRLGAFLTDLVHHASPLIVVTHDVIIRLVVLQARNQPLSEFQSVYSDNGSITQVDWEDAKLKPIRLNEIDHLGVLRSDVSLQAL